MARRTDVQILAALLQKIPRNQASVRALADLLDWPVDKVQKVVDRGVADATTPLHRGRGGVIKFRGSERGSDIGIYADVARISGEGCVLLLRRRFDRRTWAHR